MPPHLHIVRLNTKKEHGLKAGPNNRQRIRREHHVVLCSELQVIILYIRCENKGSEIGTTHTCRDLLLHHAGKRILDRLQ